jgi:tetratricopeptide (TPR) repeat protein
MKGISTSTFLAERYLDYLVAALFNQGRFPEAASYFAEALRINPGYAEAEAHPRMAESELTRLASHPHP